MKYTAIIILNYNNYEDTINCVHSIEKYNTAPIKYIVVDNGSTRIKTQHILDKTLRADFGQNYLMMNDHDDYKSILPKMTLLISKTNDGYAKGNNKGLKLAYNDNECAYVMIINNDILFIEDIIPKLLTAMSEQNDCAIISPLLYKQNLEDIDYNCARKETSVWEIIKENFLHYYYRITKKIPYTHRLILHEINRPFPSIIPIELPSGACMLMEKTYFKEIDGFDPGTFLYYEENILYKKTRSTNRQNYLYTDVKCIHLGAKSTSKTASGIIHRIGENSKDYYIKKYSGCNLITYWIFRLSSLFYKCTFFIQKKLINEDAFGCFRKL